MPYTPDTWANNDPTKPLNAARLTKLAGQYPQVMEDLPAKIADSGDPIGAALNGTIGSVAGIRVNPLEGVAFYNYGDSYGDGSQGADQVSRPFNRLALRHRTAAITLRAQAGKRMDEIAQRIFDTWTPNSRGLIGFSDGVINDLKQYGNDGSRVTTREAFRTCLALLTAKAVSGIGSLAVAFDANWSAGVTSTAGAKVNVAVTAPTVYLLVGFYDTEGGTLTIKRGATTLATVNTNGYARDIIGAVPISGLTGTTELEVTATSGTARLYGVAIPSAYPPVIVWDKPGRYSSNSTEATRLALYLAECASILGDFPSVVQADMGSGWDYTTMIGQDATHRNDYGNMFAADRIDEALSAFLNGQPRQGLNRLVLSNSDTGADVAYTAPTATPLIVVTTYAADDFNRADGAPGSTPTGSLAWTITGGTAAIASNQLAFSVVTSGGVGAFATVSTGQAAKRIAGKLPVGPGPSSGPGLFARKVGSTGYVLLKTSDKYRILKMTGSAAFTPLGDSTGVTPLAGDSVEFSLNGTTLKARVNGTVVINITDASYSAAGEDGLFVQAVGQYLDDFRVDDQVF